MLRETGAAPRTPHVLTYTVDPEGRLHVADRHSEHVACAGFRAVLGAGELTVIEGPRGVEILDVTNQSTGFCPEPESWPAVRDALARAGLVPPTGFGTAFVFPRCVVCGSIHVVKDGWFTCACGADLPEVWNLGRRGE